jgi:hypothetical membrane protein
MKKKLELSVICGAGVAIVYPVLTLISGLIFPDGANPMEDYLSYIGNYIKNPDGAWLYNINMAVVGILLFGFFYGLRVWYGDSKREKVVILLVQIIGFVEALFVVLLGVFEDGNSLHGTVSSSFFLCNITFLVVSGVGFLFHSKYFKPISIFAILVAFFNLGYLWFISSTPIIEWTTVFTAIIYFIMITINIYKKQ